MNKNKPDYMKLIRILISSHRKILLTAALSMIIGFTFLFSITALSDTIVKTGQEHTVKTYGKFLLVAPDISRDDEAEIKRQYSQFAFEHFGVVGDVGYKNKKITMGTMKEHMGENLGFRLIKGIWPQKSSQIAVEEYLLYMFGIQDKKLPCHVSLQRDGKSIEYEITGATSNYSYLLSSTTDANAEINAYPSIISGKEKPENVKKSLVILQKKLNFENAENDINSLDFLQLDNLCYNIHLYGEGYDNEKDTIHLRRAYLVILNILLLLELVVVTRVFLLRSKKTLSLFEALGLSSKEKRKVILFLVHGFTWFSLTLGYLLAVLTGYTYMNHTFRNYNKFYLPSLRHNALTEVLIAGTVLICLYFTYGNNKNDSIIKEMVSDAFSRQTVSNNPTKYKFKKLDGTIIIIQAVCIFFTLFSFYTINNFQKDYVESGNIEINLDNKIDIVSYPLKGYRIAEYRDDSFSFDDINPFREYQDYIRLSATAETRLSTILLKKDHIDSYFKQYCIEDGEEDAPEERIKKDEALWRQVSDQAEKYQPIPVPDVEFVVLPQKDFLLFLKENGIRNRSLERNTEKACILRLPNYKQPPSNPSIREKDMVDLGRIQGNDETYINFFSESFRVESILSCDEEECSTIQVVMSEETAQKSKSVSGYFSIEIEMDRKTPASIQKSIEQKAMLLIASKQGGVFSSSAQGNDRDELVRNYGSVLCNTMVIFSIIASCVYIILSIYIDWEKNSYEYGVLRSFGMSYSTLQKKLFFKYSISIVIACIISMILGKYTYLFMNMSWWQILVSIGITAGITCLCRIVVFYRKKKEMISDMVKKH